MSLLVAAAELEARRGAAAGPLRPLADSLARDLAPLIADPPFVPHEKARLSRAGGRCPNDGTPLEFDPRSPRAHRCPRCGATAGGESQYRYWLMWYQLWLSERAIHGALLGALRNDVAAAGLARHLLRSYAERYPEYPNADNVLGPSRPFFSTYLESIWLLQICVALDLLETAGIADDVGALVRERVVAPSSALVALYDEGTSNRQAWNVAALLASRLLLGDTRGARDTVRGPSGLEALLRGPLLPDGSWYEGENYHVFAHRALWYGITIAQRNGFAIDPELSERFDRGFALPFVTALPDFTMLARRDSQHGVSLRQWRFAELCELGLARGDDPRLRAALATLYDGAVPRHDTGRATSPGEAERHTPATALDRSDLGWRSLLHARAELPELAGAAPGSALLQSQGLAVLRRDAGRFFVAVDYGESGGGHGHPDRLNLVIADGERRWLDDCGTGSYVDPSLHWYRSTLAHNAPLFDRRSQPRVDGEAMAWEERGAVGWLAARARFGPDTHVERRVVVMPDYVVDELSWRVAAGHALGLPIHVDGSVAGARWAAAPLPGGGGLEDGFDFVQGSERADVEWPARVAADRGAAWVFAPEHSRLWRGVAPGAPGRGDARFHFVETTDERGTVVVVHDPRGVISSAEVRDATIVVCHADGSRHEHGASGTGWHVALSSNGATSSVDLRSTLAVPAATGPAPQAARTALRPPAFVVRRGDRRGLQLVLGENDYRRSEQSWSEAGEPTAVLRVVAGDATLVVEVESRTGAPVILPDGVVNGMDNEHPDVNASGVQLYLILPGIPPRGWLLRPGPDAAARSRPLVPGDARVAATWRPTAAGWTLRAEIPIPPGELRGALGVIVNEIPAGRERRRGQLVLGGATGEWVYLRGDRHDPSRFVGLRIT
ncbi:MAG TPA: heparinase II/III family protein [Gemmatimonadaceae bacterium]|nr:heparinase II/III family protein [Gemmatimonadaceae bacterium]